MSETNTDPSNLNILMDVPVTLTVEMGSCSMAMKDVLSLKQGAMVSLDKNADALVDVFVNQKKFAEGEVVVVKDQLGIKITRFVGDSAER